MEQQVRRAVAMASVFIASATAALVALAAVPAGADTLAPVDPVIAAITPALPAGVTVQAVASFGEELIAANPTDTPLQVMGRDGQPIVRIDSTGVLANLADPDWYLSENPSGSTPPPAGVATGATPRWARVSGTPSWSWFDPRIQPGPLPPFVAAPTVVSQWSVPMQLGSTAFTVTGTDVYRPVVGGYEVAVTSTPQNVQAVVLEGRLPGLFVSLSGHHTLVVDGADGAPFLRIDAAGVDVDQGGGWQHTAGAAGYTWLDRRLAPPVGPPGDARRAGTVRRWTIGVTLDGRRAAIGGVVRWLPANPTGGSTDGSTRRSSGWWWLWLGCGAGGALAVVGVVARALSRRQTKGASHATTPAPASEAGDSRRIGGGDDRSGRHCQGGHDADGRPGEVRASVRGAKLSRR